MYKKVFSTVSRSLKLFFLLAKDRNSARLFLFFCVCVWGGYHLHVFRNNWGSNSALAFLSMGGKLVKLWCRRHAALHCLQEVPVSYDSAGPLTNEWAPVRSLIQCMSGLRCAAWLCMRALSKSDSCACRLVMMYIFIADTWNLDYASLLWILDSLRSFFFLLLLKLV